jgi:hypothetical protein
MEIRQSAAPHAWAGHRLAAQILRSWVRDAFAQLPAWTPAPVLEAYQQLMGACEALIMATQRADREGRRDA